MQSQISLIVSHHCYQNNANIIRRSLCKCNTNIHTQHYKHMLVTQTYLVLMHSPTLRVDDIVIVCGRYRLWLIWSFLVTFYMVCDRCGLPKGSIISYFCYIV